MPQSLVLCNDSALPVGGQDHMARQLRTWSVAGDATDEPLLAGLTDSAERGLYHLQSYMLCANQALLQNNSWLRFWLDFQPSGTKDQLIDHGEIGLSQALLAAGVSLRPAFPLIEGLFEGEAMVRELLRFQIRKPMHANQAVFAWRSLLERDFPLVKKHVLFDLFDNHGSLIVFSIIARIIPAEWRPLIIADLHELFISRYCAQDLISS